MKNYESKKKKYEFKNSKSLTTLLLVITGFLVFWFLLAGSMTDNRFGAHLVWTTDLTSTPFWFGITILYISLIIMIGGVIMFSLLYREKLKLTSGQEKTIRIASFLVMGTTIFYVALSSISFAAFNSEFFISALFHGYNQTSMMGNGSSTPNILSVTDQGISIASLWIITFVAIIAISLYFIITKKEFSNKLYFTSRNVSIALIGISWFVFVLNVMAFGSMGGDAGILAEKVLAEKIPNLNFKELIETIDHEILNGHFAELALQGGTNSKDAFVYLIDTIVNNDFGIEEIGGHATSASFLWFFGGKNLHLWWDSLWTTGVATAHHSTLVDLPTINLPLPLQSIFYSLGNPNSGLEVLLNLYKPSFMLGVNNSINAYIIFAILILSPIASSIYGWLSYIKYKDTSSSLTYDISIYTIIGITAMYGLVSWIFSYIQISEFDDQWFDNALYDNKFPTLVPGLIGGIGMSGGINGAIVYFLPLYSGTILWWILLALTIIIPISSIIGVVVNDQYHKRKEGNEEGNNNKISNKELFKKIFLFKNKKKNH